MKSTTKVSKPKAFSIFDFVKAIIDTKQSWESFTPEQQKLFNGYMINKFLIITGKISNRPGLNSVILLF